jgi:hypothetical protein
MAEEIKIPSPPQTRTQMVPVSQQAPLVVAMRDPNVQRHYANGFSLGISNADAHIVLQWFGRPIAVVNFSYTLAKTLSEKLKILVADWEAKTGHPLETTDTIDQAFHPELKK